VALDKAASSSVEDISFHLVPKTRWSLCVGRASTSNNVAARFGEGHWFVGVGYDQNGVYIRDSSGWDTRYLTWGRLYGEVGFSGWVVGVA